MLILPSTFYDLTVSWGYKKSKVLMINKNYKKSKIKDQSELFLWIVKSLSNFFIFYFVLAFLGNNRLLPATGFGFNAGYSTTDTVTQLIKLYSYSVELWIISEHTKCLYWPVRGIWLNFFIALYCSLYSFLTFAIHCIHFLILLKIILLYLFVIRRPPKVKLITICHGNNDKVSLITYLTNKQIRLV